MEIHNIVLFVGKAIKCSFYHSRPMVPPWCSRVPSARAPKGAGGKASAPPFLPLAAFLVEHRLDCRRSWQGHRCLCFTVHICGDILCSTRNLEPQIVHLPLGHTPTSTGILKFPSSVWLWKAEPFSVIFGFLIPNKWFEWPVKIVNILWHAKGKVLPTQLRWP